MKSGTGKSGPSYEKGKGRGGKSKDMRTGKGKSSANAEEEQRAEPAGEPELGFLDLNSRRRPPALHGGL